jgi:hypothetical protein
MELSPIQNKELIERLNNANDFIEVVNILKEYSNYELKGSHLGRAFEKMFIQDQGFSSSISMDELQKYHHSFYTTNGGDWCRSNQGYLGSKYNIERELRGGRIFSVKVDGYNKNTKINQSIRSDIFKEIRSRRCAILDISTNTEVDHKDGMKDDWRLNDKSYQKLEDFQPLSKTANDAKRQHCKRCLETGIRYDAKKLGYSESYVFGNASSKTCVGCYWYDPVAFNKEISKDFIKSDK